MFGSRKRIGFISPTVVEMTAYDFYNFAPPGVGLVGVTCNIDGWAKAEFDKALTHVLDLSRYLASRKVDFIIHAGEPLVTSTGGDFDVELVKMIEDAAGIPATTTIRAAIEGMELMGMVRIGIASPYPVAMNETLAGFLAAKGFEVVKHDTMDVPFKQTQFVEPAAIHRFVGAFLADAPALDGIYMPCPQWPVCDAIQRMEDEFGVPIVAGDLADFSAAFRALGISDARPGYGRLMSMTAAAPATASA